MDIYITAFLWGRKVKRREVERISDTHVVGKAGSKHESVDPGLVLNVLRNSTTSEGYCAREKV